MTERDVDFHEVIYQATGNQRLVQIINNLREQMYRYRLEYIKDEAKRAVLTQEHEMIIQALASRDPEAGKEAVRRHIDNQEITVTRNLKGKN